MKKIFFTALITLVSMLPLSAQDAAVSQVSGIVRDSRGTPIPNARVGITNVHTSAVRTAQTGADGAYSFTNLAVGPYELQVATDGFATHNQTGILLQANASSKVDIMMLAGTDLSHVHLLLNHFPTVGMVIGLGLYLVALFIKSDDLKRASLVIFVGIALLAVPLYVTGNGAQSTICQAKPEDPCADPTVSKSRIEAHEGAALVAFAVMEVLGAFAWLGLWQYRRTSRVADWNLSVILLLAVATFGLMANTADIGGDIHHPEIRTIPDVPTARLAREVGVAITNAPWGWPACETLHFIGLTLLIGVVLTIDLRMLGVMKNVGFPAIHRLLPWGILGFGINTVTGMAFFVASPGQYTGNVSFYWKLGLMLLAGANMLYFTMLDEAWEIRSGEDAPFTAKLVAGSALVLWVGVMYFGSMLPFIGNAF
jgi:uncharacterized membrane protein